MQIHIYVIEKRIILTQGYLFLQIKILKDSKVIVKRILSKVTSDMQTDGNFCFNCVD